MARVGWRNEDERQVALKLLEKLKKELFESPYDRIEDYSPWGKYGWWGYIKFLEKTASLAKDICCSGTSLEDDYCRLYLEVTYTIDYSDGDTAIYIIDEKYNKVYKERYLIKPRHGFDEELTAYRLLQVVEMVCKAKKEFYR